MRIVLSRKGFDSSFGGCPSPLLDGRPLSLPIPVAGRSQTTYGDLPEPIPALVAGLTRGRLAAHHLCHLDPDLDAGNRGVRPAGWRGALGQVAQAQRHLENRGVGPGDLFIFWGLFRPVEEREGCWRFVGRPIHAAFGWLQIERVVRHPGGGPLPALPWLADHPHTQPGWGHDNTIYVAQERLSSFDFEAPGYGVFRRAFALTSPTAASPSSWLMPAWLHPASGGTGLTYHPAARWLDGPELRAAPWGQEFVAEVGAREDARAWIARLIADHA